MVKFPAGQEIFLFCKASRLAVRPMQPPVQWGVDTFRSKVTGV